MWIEILVRQQSQRTQQVTPCVGVWIEMSSLLLIISRLLVTPCVGVWIEMLPWSFMSGSSSVTPCVGVWIEMHLMLQFSKANVVTPCVGVWIEMFITSKHINAAITVTPCVGVWIEIVWFRISILPTLSLPAWECGLKFTPRLLNSPVIKVTPCVGVWIEIKKTYGSNDGTLGHSLRGSVD